MVIHIENDPFHAFSEGAFPCSNQGSNAEDLSFFNDDEDARVGKKNVRCWEDLRSQDRKSLFTGSSPRAWHRLRERDTTLAFKRNTWGRVFLSHDFPRLQNVCFIDEDNNLIHYDQKKYLIESKPPEAVGVLICTKTSDGKLYFLLGKEAHRPRFEATGTWCDFGGRVEQNTSPLENAARELIEEASGVFGTDLNHVIRFIQENAFMIVRANTGNRKPYDMFVLIVPWFRTHDSRVKVLTRFAKGKRAILEKPLSKKLKRHHLEKSELAWFSPMMDSFRLLKDSMLCSNKRGTWGFNDPKTDESRVQRKMVLRKEFGPILFSINLFLSKYLN